MRLIIHNPHVETHIGKTVCNFLTKRYNHRKYWYLMELIKSYSDNVFLFVDKKDTSFNFFRNSRLLKIVEIYIWLIINKLNIFKVKIIFENSNIQKEDIFLSFTFRNLDREYAGLDFLKSINCLKLFHLTHYMLNTTTIARNSQLINLDFFIGENNLKKNSKYFQHFFGFYDKDVYILPFTFQPRFEKRVGFDKRKNKCLATGTFEIVKRNPRTDNFLDFFAVNTFHPMRKNIYDNKETLTDLIDSYISDYNEVKPKKGKKDNPVLIKLYHKIYNIFKVKQSKYFKFNIVTTYNDYKMFIVPEEINNLPGIGFVEGMACGAAFIGKKDLMYSDIGLQSGIHYIEYDGSLDDLKKKIEYYQNNNEELECIADNGHTFIIENLNGKVVAEKFWHDLKLLYDKYLVRNFNKDNLTFPSSFYVSS